MILKLLFPVLLLVSIASCENKEEYYLENNTEYAQLALKTNAKGVEFELFLNTCKFPLDSGAILALLEEKAKQDSSSLHIAAWQFISDQTIHASPLQTTAEVDAFSFISSSGYGLCNNRAEVLSQLWKLLGYESRVCYLSGHVVPEIRIEEAWQVFDPDHEVFYLDSQKRVLSAESLIKNSHFIHSPVNTDLLDVVDDEFSDFLKYNPHTAQIFSLSHMPSYRSLELPLASSSVFKLPSNTKFTFPVTAYYHEDFIHASHSFLKVTLYAAQEAQQLEVPLLYYGQIGKAEVIAENTGATTLHVVTNISDSVELLFMVNHRLQSILPFQSLKLIGTNLSQAQIKLQPSTALEVNPHEISNFILNKVKALPSEDDWKNLNLASLYKQTLFQIHSIYGVEINDKLLLADSQSKKIKELLKKIDTASYPDEFVFYILMVMYNNELERFNLQVERFIQNPQNLE